MESKQYRYKVSLHDEQPFHDTGPLAQSKSNKKEAKTGKRTLRSRNIPTIKHYTTHFLPEPPEINPTFSYAEILPLIKYLGYTQEESSELLDANASTISRWKNSDKRIDIGKLRSKVMLDIDAIVSKGVRIFGSEELFQEWLNTTNYALGDIKPVELLKNVYSIELVGDTLDALAWGSYL